VEKYGRAGQATDGSLMLRVRIECVAKAAETRTVYEAPLLFHCRNIYASMFGL